MIMTFMEVKCQQRSNIVNYALWPLNLIRRTADAEVRMMMTCMEVKCQQRSNTGNGSHIALRSDVFVNVRKNKKNLFFFFSMPDL